MILTTAHADMLDHMRRGQSIPSPKHPRIKLWLGLCVVVLVPGLYLGTISALPASAEVTRAEIIMSTGTLLPPAPEAGVDLPEHLTATIFLEIKPSPKGQRIRIEQVRFLNGQGTVIARASVQFLSRRLRTEIPDAPGGPVFTETTKAVDGDLFLWPLEGATLQFPVTTSAAPELGTDDRVIAEVIGKAGNVRFTARSKPSEVIRSGQIQG